MLHRNHSQLGKGQARSIKLVESLISWECTVTGRSPEYHKTFGGEDVINGKSDQLGMQCNWAISRISLNVRGGRRYKIPI